MCNIVKVICLMCIFSVVHVVGRLTDLLKHFVIDEDLRSLHGNVIFKAV